MFHIDAAQINMGHTSHDSGMDGSRPIIMNGEHTRPAHGAYSPWAKYTRSCRYYSSFVGVVNTIHRNGVFSFGFMFPLNLYLGENPALNELTSTNRNLFSTRSSKKRKLNDIFFFLRKCVFREHSIWSCFERSKLIFNCHWNGWSGQSTQPKFRVSLFP